MTVERPANSDQSTWSVLAHASAFIQLIGIPSVVGPFVVWLLRRTDPVVEPHARAALNFQLSLIIYFVAGTILAVLFALTIVGILLSVLLIILLGLLVIAELVFALLASLAASRGELFSYPMSLELIKA
jgi:uncharacterized Tic20 family protein